MRRIALRLLRISATSAAVERTWAEESFIHTPKRNRLSLSTIENALFVRGNALLNRQTAAYNRAGGNRTKPRTPRREGLPERLQQELDSSHEAHGHGHDQSEEHSLLVPSDEVHSSGHGGSADMYAPSNSDTDVDDNIDTADGFDGLDLHRSRLADSPAVVARSRRERAIKLRRFAD